MADFWKIQCLQCGINADLLTDDWNRIICRECLHESEFREVSDEIVSEGKYPNGSGNSFKKDLGYGESLAVSEESEADTEDDENDSGIDLFTEGY